MPGPLAHVGNTTLCTHGVPATVVPTNFRVLVSGQPVTTLADTYLIAGCPFTVPVATPMPCVRIQWLTPAVRVMVNGSPALLQTSTGLCISAQQSPNGPPSVVVNQPRVIGT
jgi:hypothetical protein